MQARHNASVQYMAMTFTISAFLKLKSETSRVPKQEPALSPLVLPSLTVPSCLELRTWVWKWSPEAVSVWGLARSASQHKFSWSASVCPPGFSGGSACFAYTQGRYYPPQVFPARPLGNPEWQEALGRTGPTRRMQSNVL